MAYGAGAPGRTCCRPSPACGTPRAARLSRNLFLRASRGPRVTQSSVNRFSGLGTCPDWFSSSFSNSYPSFSLYSNSHLSSRPGQTSCLQDLSPPQPLPTALSLSTQQSTDVGPRLSSSEPHCERTVPRLLSSGAASPSENTQNNALSPYLYKVSDNRISIVSFGSYQPAGTR